ncbi:fasciclin-2-like [Limulus polyphemus]|uniref:Fasciclin-2-like n=1 Tax=Limulus polyphemus TaxID=6850 RepID=A0ABM1BIF7_LIMPO|nr:fasciclin-2-like [Limulus polyphemus]
MWNWRWISVLVSTVLLGCFAQELKNKVKLSIQPLGNAQTRPAGESFALTCTGDSDDNSLFSEIKWENPSGEVLGQSGSDQNIEVNKIMKNILSLVFVKPKTGDTGMYTCKATYNDTETLETGVEVTFFHDITWEDCLEKQSLVVNQPGELKCLVSADPSPQVSWTKLEGSETIPLDTSRFKVDIKKGVLISEVHEDDGGKYRIQAIVTETGRFKHQDIVVEVLIPPNFTESQDDAQALEEEDVVLNCRADVGYPIPTYSWLDLNGEKLNSQERFIVDEATGTLTIQEVSKDDAGIYTCIAENKAGSDQKIMKLTVFSKPKIIQFENKTSVEATTVTLECHASGVPSPELTIFKDGDQQVETGDRILTEKSQGEEVVILTITINKVEKDDDGEYFCHAENVAGKVEMAGHLSVEFKPQMHTPKSEFMKTWNDNPVNLSCVAEAFPVATIRWFFDTQEIVSDESENYTIFGKEGHSNLLLPKCINKSVSDSLKATPGKLLQVKYEDTTATTISFEFLGPDDDGGMPILAYMVKYREESDLPEDAEIMEWKAGTIYTLESLKPRATYKFQFAVKNAVGTGMWTEENSWTMPAESAPEPPTIISPPGNESTYPDKMEIKWNINEDNGKPIQYFQLRYFKVKRENDEKKIWKQYGKDKVINIKEDWESGHFTITGLEPNSYYKVELRARNEIGFSQDETMIFRTALGIMDSDQKAPIAQEDVPTAVIIAVVVLLILVILIVIDVTCYFRYHWGVLYFLRNNACGKSSEDKSKEAIADEEKGSIPAHKEQVKSTDEVTGSASPTDDKKDLIQESDEKHQKPKDGEVASEDTPMIDPSSEKEGKIEENDKNQSLKGSKTSLPKDSAV